MKGEKKNLEEGNAGKFLTKSLKKEGPSLEKKGFTWPL